MTELESKIWDMVHKWCDGQCHEIPDQNRRYLMDEIKALVLSDVVVRSEQLECAYEGCENTCCNVDRHGLCCDCQEDMKHTSN